MVVLDEARRAVGVVRDAPFLLAAAALPAIAGSLQIAAQTLTPIASTAAAAVTFFVSPFLVAGLLGSIADARDAATSSWSSWLAWARDRYLALLLANVGFFAVVVALGFVVGFVVAFGGIAVGAGIAASGGGGAVGVGLLLAFVVMLAFVFAVTVVFAYYSVAAVVGERSPVDALRESYRLATDHVTSTVGVVVLNGVISIALGVPSFVVGWQFVDLPPDAPTIGLTALSPATVAALAAVGLVATTLSQAYTSTLLVGVYRRLRDDTAPDAPASPAHDG